MKSKQFAKLVGGGCRHKGGSANPACWHSWGTVALTFRDGSILVRNRHGHVRRLLKFVYESGTPQEEVDTTGQLVGLDPKSRYDILDGTTGAWVARSVQGAQAESGTWAVGDEAWPVGEELFRDAPAAVAVLRETRC